MKRIFGSRQRDLQREHEPRVYCAFFDECPFFRKHGHTPEFRMKGYEHIYCAGPRMKECARLRFYTDRQSEPPVDMAPTGIIVGRNE